MLLKRNDVRSALPDNKNQTPLSLAISAGHDRIARILQGLDNFNSEKSDHSGPESLQLSPEHDCAAEMEVRSHDPNTDTTAFSRDDNSDKANDGGRASILPSARLADEFVDNFNTGQANHGGQKAPPPSSRRSQLRSI